MDSNMLVVARDCRRLSSTPSRCNVSCLLQSLIETAQGRLVEAPEIRAEVIEGGFRPA
jgi:hypothetical protein